MKTLKRFRIREGDGPVLSLTTHCSVGHLKLVPDDRTASVTCTRLLVRSILRH